MTKKEEYLYPIDYIDNSNICELAHSLLLHEAKLKGFKVKDKAQYTKREQKIFDYYYNLITNTLNI